MNWMIGLMLGWMLNSVGCWKYCYECAVKDKYAVDEDDVDENDVENKVSASVFN
jgi:hypothetical protein